MKSRLAKAQHAFVKLKPVMSSSKYNTKTKQRIFKSNVLSVLLYGSETWKVTKAICHSLDVFQTRCLRRIFKIYWPNTISNEELLARSCLKPVSIEIQQRRWRWLGHILRMPSSSPPKIALKWTPEGKRSHGRPKETWCHTIERERKKEWTWSSMEKMAQDRSKWRTLTSA